MITQPWAMPWAQGVGDSNPLAPTNQTRPFLFQGFASRPIQRYLNSSLSPSSSLAIVIRQPASKKSGWLSIRLAPPRCSTSLRFGWTPLDCAARAGARSKHGSRQTKTKPVWHAPRRHFEPCHPSLCCVSPLALRAVVLLRCA